MVQAMGPNKNAETFGTIPAPKKSGQISDALSRLNTALELNKELINQLEMGISSVLTDVVDDVAKSTAGQPPQVMLANILNEMSSRLSSNNNKLNDMLNRLEL